MDIKKKLALKLAASIMEENIEKYDMTQIRQGNVTVGFGEAINILNEMSEKESSNKGDKIKVSELEIVVRIICARPYFELKYREVGKNHYTVGYSSYDLEKVLIWRKEYFELVKENPTNIDIIRSMTNEELATLFSQVTNDVLGGSTWNKKQWIAWLSEKSEGDPD